MALRPSRGPEPRSSLSRCYSPSRRSSLLAAWRLGLHHFLGPWSSSIPQGSSWAPHPPPSHRHSSDEPASRRRSRPALHQHRAADGRMTHCIAVHCDAVCPAGNGVLVQRHPVGGGTFPPPRMSRLGLVLVLSSSISSFLCTCTSSSAHQGELMCPPGRLSFRARALSACAHQGSSRSAYPVPTMAALVPL